MSAAVRVRDLPDLFGRPGPHPFLYCLKCGAEYSAHSGDYFNRLPDHVFTCCRRNMVLVTRETTLRPYRSAS
jgi:hypothetical protein